MRFGANESLRLTLHHLLVVTPVVYIHCCPTVLHLPLSPHCFISNSHIVWKISHNDWWYHFRFAGMISSKIPILATQPLLICWSFVFHVPHFTLSFDGAIFFPFGFRSRYLSVFFLHLYHSHYTVELFPSTEILFRWDIFPIGIPFRATWVIWHLKILFRLHPTLKIISLVVLVLLVLCLLKSIVHNYFWTIFDRKEH